MARESGFVVNLTVSENVENDYRVRSKEGDDEIKIGQGCCRLRLCMPRH